MCQDARARACDIAVESPPGQAVRAATTTVRRSWFLISLGLAKFVIYLLRMHMIVSSPRSDCLEVIA